MLDRNAKSLDLIDPGIHLFVGFRGLGLKEELEGIIREFRPGGIVLFKRNVENRSQVKKLVADAREFSLEETGRPLLVAIDQEGGPVQRLSPHFTDLPSAKELAAEGPEAIKKWARKAAFDLVEIGIQINFAPVLDIVPEGNHFLHPRSLGSSPQMVAELGRAWIEALQENGVSATAKHFPGLGRAALDPHHFSPVIQDKDPAGFFDDLLPFRAAMDAGVHCVMSSHAVYPAIDPARPATLSRKINHQILREDLGFGGVLLSDDLDMEAIGANYSPEQVLGLALACSTDFMLLCQKIDNIRPFFRAIAELIESNEQMRKAHAQSRARIARLFQFHFPY